MGRILKEFRRKNVDSEQEEAKLKCRQLKLKYSPGLTYLECLGHNLRYTTPN